MTAPPKRLISDRLKFANGKGDDVDGSNSVEIAKKSRKLKGQKLSKSRKLAKSEKNLLKSENSPNFDVKNNRPSFLTLIARTAFNHLWLAFTKAPIF